MPELQQHSEESLQALTQPLRRSSWVRPELWRNQCSILAADVEKDPREVQAENRRKVGRRKIKMISVRHTKAGITSSLVQPIILSTLLLYVFVFIICCLFLMVLPKKAKPLCCQNFYCFLKKWFYNTDTSLLYYQMVLQATTWHSITSTDFSGYLVNSLWPVYIKSCFLVIAMQIYSYKLTKLILEKPLVSGQLQSS